MSRTPRREFLKQAGAGLFGAAALGAGSRAPVVLSGNTLFWRVSLDEESGVIECRKADAPGDQVPSERRGECWHSQDGLRGGLLAECGYPG